jgi:hypothetical protein
MVAVIVPSYKVKYSILDVLSKIGPEVGKIYVVDDACPILVKIDGDGQMDPVLLAGLPIILGFQSLLAFLHFDLANIPQKAITAMEI